jgi:hypothetical protein
MCFENLKINSKTLGFGQMFALKMISGSFSKGILNL